MITIDQQLRHFGFWDSDYNNDWQRMTDNPWTWEGARKIRREDFNPLYVLGDWLIIDSKPDFWYADLVGCEFFGAGYFRTWRRPDGVDQPYLYDVKPIRAVGRVWWEVGRAVGGDSVMLM